MRAVKQRVTRVAAELKIIKLDRDECFNFNERKFEPSIYIMTIDAIPVQFRFITD